MMLGAGVGHASRAYARPRPSGSPDAIAAAADAHGRVAATIT
jgi:hypothetical protein